MRRYVKPALILTAIVLVILAICIMARTWGEWQWISVVILGVGMSALARGIFFLKKWLFRRSDKKFVGGIMDEEEDAAKQVVAADQQAIGDLQKRWKDAMEALRRAHMKKKGQAYQVQPWFMIMGEPGSGKTAAIKGSRLHSALTDVSPSSATSGTGNCDWWFFEKSLILDTAGRYTVWADEDQDKPEWREFVMLLAKYRKRKPINGLIVTVAADKLVNAEPDALADYGRTIRRRINELMRAFGTRFPVYVLVTKIDQMFGVMALCDQLPEAALGSAMGRANSALRADAVGVLERTFVEIPDRIRGLEVLLLHRGEEPDPGILLLPEELAKLKPGLGRFVEAIFQKSGYHEDPILRGIYFSSARQETSDVKLPASLSAFQSSQKERPGGFRGLFLRDFFSKILPGDKELLAPLMEAVATQRKIKTIGVAAWIAIMIFIAGLLTISFFKNLGIIDSFKHDLEFPSLEAGGEGNAQEAKQEENADRMAKFQAKLSKLHKETEKGIPIDMGLDASERLTEAAKKAFCQLLRKHFLDELDKRITDNIKNLSVEASKEFIGKYAEHLQTRVGLLKTRLSKDQDGDQLLKELKSASESIFKDLRAIDVRLIPDMVSEHMFALYQGYLLWDQNREMLEQEKTDLTGNLITLAVKGENLNWLVGWANLLPDIKKITMAQFWGRETEAAEYNYVPRAYTREGQKKIFGFIDRTLELLVDDDINHGKLLGRKNKFQNWYQSQYLKAWRRFCKNFILDSRQLEESERIQLAQDMGDPKKNPYFKLLDSMADHLSDLPQKDEAQKWVKWATEFPRNRKLAEGVLMANKEGSTADDEKPNQRRFSDKAITAKMPQKLAAYVKWLKEVGKKVKSDKDTYKMFSKLYQRERSNPLFESYTAYKKIERLYNQSRERNPYLALLAGPVAYQLNYAGAVTRDRIQEQWREKVLSRADGLSGPELKDALFGEGGVVRKFVKESPGSTFIEYQAASGRYVPKRALGNRFPFSQKFLEFVNKGFRLTSGKVKDEYKIKVRFKPTGAEGGKISKTVLTLQCGDMELQKLENRNFGKPPQSFTWKPGTCGDVRLEMFFKKGFRVSRVYKGAYGFRDFMKDFRTGARVFVGERFSKEDREKLKRHGVRSITVKYKFSGQDAKAVGKLSSITLPRTPRAIIQKPTRLFK
jgi:type VI secretion system protein ImpL